MRSWFSILFLITALQIFGQEPMLYLPSGTILDDTDMAQDLNEAFSFTKYPTYNQYLEMMSAMAEDFPAICMLDTIGYSVQDRLILALKISDNVKESEGEAKFLYTSSMHGDELVGYVLLLRLSKFLLDNYGTDSEVNKIIDSLEIWINPLANPDGTFYPDDNNSVINAIRKNSRGADLNRDYPDPGKSETNDTTGREQETRVMMDFMMKNYFTLSANIHGGEEVVNYPWDYKSNIYHPDNDWFYLVSREYADEAKAVDPTYMSGFTDGITIGWAWYVIGGGRQDYVTYYLQGREVTLELSYAYTPESEQLNSFWEKNERSLINYMSQALYGIRGKVSSTLSGVPIKANIFITEHDNDQSWISSDSLSGNFYRLIKEGSYNLVVSAEGYISDTILDVDVVDYHATWLDIQLDSVADPSGGYQREFNDLDYLSLYPNPVKEHLYINFSTISQELIRFNVYTIEGRMIQSNNNYYGTSVISIDVSNLEPGLYFLRVESDENITTHKFIKQ